MEQIYAFGVTCIEFVQYWFEDNANFFEFVNHACNPQYAIDYLFPLMAVIDSVFAAQLLLCLAFGGWLNAVMKWWLLEDRPYWWIRETTFYSEPERPVLQQTLQTCETGPGSPSGHSMTAAMMLILCLMWISHVMHDRKYYIWWWKHLMYPLFAAALCSVMLARLFVAAHFPHQCLIGALIGECVPTDSILFQQKVLHLVVEAPDVPAVRCGAVLGDAGALVRSRALPAPVSDWRVNW
ncbi:hypothetical protein PYW07_011683 [Mythimna separata]|uniref:glucose-6-phosphatase n=1 Tax=Mythimna separata TaxID=271217 RepID=A0AAD7Y730_MYTSE|nr:hypothetical protein PYW07_011683 [Mythimna separata]